MAIVGLLGSNLSNFSGENRKITWHTGVDCPPLIQTEWTNEYSGLELCSEYGDFDDSGSKKKKTVPLNMIIKR